MKRTAIIFSALLMGSAMASYPAMAQSTNDSSNMSNGSMGTMGADNTNNTDQQKMQSDSMSTGSTTGAMTNAQMVGKLQTMDVAAVNVARLSDMATTDTEVSETVPSNPTPEEQQQLQAAIKGNSKLMDALQKQSIDPSQVVAANVGANNTVTLYVK